MFESRLVDVERRREMEDGFAVLDGSDASAGKTSAVARAIDEIDDRRREITGAEKVAVHRVRVARRVDRSLRGDERLREDLTAEDATGADIAVEPAINIDLEWLEIEQSQEFVQRFGDAASLEGG